MYVRQCFCEISNISRCTLNRNVKPSYEIEPDLLINSNCDLRKQIIISMTKICSHKVLVEIGKRTSPQTS